MHNGGIGVCITYAFWVTDMGNISFSTQIHCFPDLPEKVLMLVVVRVVIMVVAKVVRVRLILCCLRGFGS